MKKIDVAELLRNCPSGMELDCTMFEGVEFDGIVDNKYTPIRCRIKNPDGGYNVYFFTKHGYWNDDCKAKCVIFPKGKTTWEGFHRPFKDGDIIAFNSRGGAQLFIFKEYIYNNNYAQCYMMLDCDGAIDFECGDYYVERFATEEEKEKLFDAIKANGYKWNPKTKTLEKLVEPQFKIGDIIQDIDAYKVKITEINIGDECYGYESIIAKGIGGIPFNEQGNWKLVRDKFDINTLVPFESRVLARDNEREKWIPAFWGFYDVNSDYPYKLIGCMARYCIPYEGNEHLCGKTGDCDKYFKTWDNGK